MTTKYSPDQWTPMTINHNLLQVIAGASTRAISGTSLCRNRQWMSTCVRYVENVFITTLILRLFPRTFHRCISPFLPSFWLVHFHLRRAKKIITPIIEERLQKRKISNEKIFNEEVQRPLDLLQYMIDHAENEDLDSERLAHLVLMSNIAGIHTTTMAITHAVYDLCEHQEYIPLLREEIEQVLLNDGGWQPDTHNKLHKFDSFLKESQRFSPISLCECTILISVLDCWWF